MRVSGRVPKSKYMKLPTSWNNRDPEVFNDTLNVNGASINDAMGAFVEN